MTGDARATYNRLSRVYGWLSDASERTFVEQSIAALLQPQPGEAVLEPGFGTGQVLLALAEAVGPEGRVAGIDIADGMVEQARNRLAQHRMADRVELLRGDMRSAPYPDATFDAVFMSFTLELFSDNDQGVVLYQVRRVLVPGGRLCVACMSDHGGQPIMDRLYRWSHEHFPTFVDCRPIDSPALLAASGFSVEQVRRLSMWGLSVDLVLARVP